MASGDCFVSACATEAIGLCLMEAMASGVPVVAPDSGGIPEVVKPDLNGFLYRNFDVDAAADGVIASLRHRDRLSKNAVVSMSTHSWSRSMEELEDAYHIGRPGPPPPVKSVQESASAGKASQPAARALRARAPRSKSPQRIAMAVNHHVAPGA